jgi:hypothetical protein
MAVCHATTKANGAPSTPLSGSRRARRRRGKLANPYVAGVAATVRTAGARYLAPASSHHPSQIAEGVS